MARRSRRLAGRSHPRRKRAGYELTVADLCNHFLIWKEEQKVADELAPRTFARYVATAEYLVEQFGRHRLVDDLRPDDFRQLRATMSKRWGPVAISNEIQTIRSIFRYQKIQSGQNVVKSARRGGVPSEGPPEVS